MKSNYWNSFLIIIFLIVAFLGYFTGINYKESQKRADLEQLYTKVANFFSNRLEVLIEEKKNATLTIGLALAENESLFEAIQNRKNIQKELTDFSKKLKDSTDFQNVWIQLIDSHGVVISRSWTESIGDDLKKIRLDVSKMTRTPKVSSSISVGKYDLSFKAMIPFFDEKRNFIGYLELITHFNSVAKKLKQEGLETVILVDKSYKKQIVHPFTNKFIGEYYVANNNVSDTLLEYVTKLGVESVVSYKEKHSITEDGLFLRANYTLFESESRPLGYILMFKKVSDIDTEAIKSGGYLIDIGIVFLITVVGFLLSFFVKREENFKNKQEETLKYILLFFVFFVSIIVLYYVLLNTYKTSQQRDFLESYNKNIVRNYNIISEKFEMIAEAMFETTLNSEDVHGLLKEAYGDKKDLAREKLYQLLKSDYEYFSNYDVRQLHFHLKNNESFLRFHRPGKYGDDLTAIRATVAWVNNNHQKVKGFEEGKIYNGFRYVFPLSYVNENNLKEHLGSVEVSFSAHAVVNDFVKSHDAKVGFLISKGVVDAKLFDDEKSNYSQSEFENFYYDSAIKKMFQKAFSDIEIEKISQKDIQYINEKIKDGEVFTLTSKDGNILFSLLPLRSAISQKVVAAIVLQIDNRILKKENELFMLIFLVGTILILLAVIFIYREFTLKLEFLNLSLKTRQILDTQKSMIVITDGEEISDVNEKFLDFFGFDSLESFKNKHHCICDLFVEDDNYFHRKKVPEGRMWIEYIRELAHKERVVLLKDLEDVGHSFAVTFSSYNTSHYILTFADISGTIEEQLVLENKVIHDKLTGAYNREFFELKSNEIAASNRKSERELGIIFFDIDHFKSVNDTYGHAIGDYVLQELIKRISASIRSNDYLVRWGGEEFVILLSANSISELERIAENLRLMIEEYYFEHVKSITCSFGVTLSRDEEPISSTLERADKALYISKKSGRNRVTKL